MCIRDSLPSETWICDGFSINMISANLLIARCDITFNHETFYQFMKFRIDHTTVKNLFGDTNLLFIPFVGVGVVGVYDNCRVLEILFLIFFPQKTKIFVMVVRDSLSMFIYSTTKDGMCKDVYKRQGIW